MKGEEMDGMGGRWEERRARVGREGGRDRGIEGSRERGRGGEDKRVRTHKALFSF